MIYSSYLNAGHEWNMIIKEYTLFSRIGQFLVELHASGVNYVSEPKTPKDLLDTMEQNNLRMFFKEYNVVHPDCCCEMSFIQQSWGIWDERKLSLPPL